MSDKGYDSDGPEEFTQEQAIQKDEEIRKVQKESKARVIREGKERRRLWAQKKTPWPSRKDENVHDAEPETHEESETHEQPLVNRGMLPSDIVELLAAREKQVFLSDSEDEKAEVKHAKRNKKLKSSGVEAVVLKDIPPAQCLKNSLEFLNKRKMQVSRSSAVLRNSNQALRLLSSTFTKN